MDAIAVFRSKAPAIMANLLGDFPINTEDGAAIVGNLGHECLGFTKLQEMAPTVKGSRGGWGWPQWTGPRRRAFEAYCKRNNLDPSSDKANYAYLFLELKSSEKAAINKTRAAQGLFAKVKAFELSFLRAGVKHYDQRNDWALKAKMAYEEAGSPNGGTAPAVQIEMLQDEAKASDKRSSQATASGGAASASGAVSIGGAALTTADWVLLGGFGVLMLAVGVYFVLAARAQAAKARDLKLASDAVALQAAMFGGAK